MPRVEGLAPAHEVQGHVGVPVTVEAYLTANLEQLVEGAPPAPQDQALLDEVRRRYAPRPLTGSQLYARLEASRLLPTGCEGIDAELLRGGLRGGQVAELCGESASGKTQLCLSAAALAALCGERVVVLDTSNALSARRLAQVVQARRRAAEAEAAARGVPPPQAPPEPLKFVEVRRCYDVHALLAALDELAAQHAQQQQAAQQQAAAGGGGGRRRLEELPVGLLVVDSLSAAVAPVLGGGQHGQGHALLAAAAAALKAFAAATGAAVLVTNHMVGGGDERRHDKRPALGESWRNQPHARVQLARAAPPAAAGCCTATLRASSHQACGAAVRFWLGEAGPTSQPPAGQQAGQPTVAAEVR